MAEPDNPDEELPKKRSKKPLLMGIVLAVILGGGAFFAVWSGIILAPPPTDMEAANADVSDIGMAPLPDVVFVPLDPLVVNIGTESTSRHLRFLAQLEVKRSAKADVTLLLPRVTDVLNGYLRAVDISELEKRTALVRIRAQMLRRIQVVTGEDRVRDLLIMEFVLN